MSNQEAVIELVKRLPPDLSLYEIAREIEFVAAVREGLEEIDSPTETLRERGEGIDIEKVEEAIESWITE